MALGIYTPYPEGDSNALNSTLVSWCAVVMVLCRVAWCGVVESVVESVVVCCSVVVCDGVA